MKKLTTIIMATVLVAAMWMPASAQQTLCDGQRTIAYDWAIPDGSAAIRVDECVNGECVPIREGLTPDIVLTVPQGVASYRVELWTRGLQEVGCTDGEPILEEVYVGPYQFQEFTTNVPPTPVVTASHVIVP